MSNYDPSEAPTPKQPNPGDEIHAPGGVYYAPKPPGQDVVRGYQQIANILDGIRISNDKIRSVMEGMAEMLKAHKQEYRDQNQYIDEQVNKTTKLTQATKAQMSVEEQLAASQQELLRQRNELEQRNVLVRQNAAAIEERYRRFQKGSIDDRMAELQRLGMVQRDDRGNRNVTIGGQRYPAETVAGALGTNQPSQEQSNLLSQLNQHVGIAMSNAAAVQAPRTVERLLDSVEEAGIQQLRYGQLPLQDILRAAGTLMGRGYQRMTPPPRIPGVASEEELAMPARGMLSQRLAGMLGMGARWLPVAGQAMALGQTFSRTVQNVYDRTWGNMYAQPTAAGQLTGEGWRAGIGARMEGFKLGANPFDLISMQTAREIVQQARTRGWTGRRGQDVMEGMRSVINDLGIEVGTAADYFTDAMRRGGMSVSEVRTELERFDTSAHNLNMNVNDYTQQIMQNTETLRGQGAGRAAPGIAKSLTAAAPVGWRSGEGQQAFQQIFGAARGEIASRLGGGANILNLTSQRYAPSAYNMLDTIMAQQIRFAEASLPPDQRTPNDIANYLSQVGPYTQGVPVDFLASYITRMTQNRGVSAQGVFSHAERRWADQLTANRTQNSQVLRIGHMTDDQLQRLGITKTRQVTATKGSTPPSFTYTTRSGQRLGANAYRRAIGNYDADTVEQMRQQLLSDLKPYLTRQQREQLATASPLDVVQELRNISEGGGPQRGASIQTGTVTIRLKPGMESRLFELTNAQNDAVSRGNVAPNTLPSGRK